MIEPAASRAALKGLEMLWGSDLIAVELPAPAEVSAVATDPYSLLRSLAVLHPGRVGTMMIDLPRASSKAPARFLGEAEGASAIEEVRADDPSYRFRFTTNALVVFRLVAQAIAPDGLVAAVASPDHYMEVRGALEHVFGASAFYGELVYQRRTGGGPDSRTMSVDHETLVLFSPSAGARPSLRLDHSDVDEARFSEEDAAGRFYWDTAIRRAAGNYYPVTLPDGTVLENDEHGNPISWSWKRSTFDEYVKTGVIEFYEKDGEWKVRRKVYKKADGKILRSIIKNETGLDDVVEGATGSGRDLLTQRGGEEIKAFSGDKPHFLKASTYFGFVMALGGVDGPLVVPFADYGSSVVAAAALPEVGRPGLLANVGDEYEALVEWRFSALEIGGATPAIATPQAIDVAEAIQRSTDDADAVLSLVAARAGVPVSLWSEFQLRELHAFYCVGDDASHLLLVDVPDVDLDSTPPDPLLVLAEAGVALVPPVTVWTLASPDRVLTSADGQATIRPLPASIA